MILWANTSIERAEFEEVEVRRKGAVGNVGNGRKLC